MGTQLAFIFPQTWPMQEYHFNQTLLNVGVGSLRFNNFQRGSVKLIFGKGVDEKVFHQIINFWVLRV